MKFLPACVVVFVALSTTANLAQRPTDLVGQSFKGHVVGVVDGDTVDVLKAQTKRTVRVRVDGVDTPERGEPFTQQARNFTRVFAFDRDVIVSGKDVDRYGRLVARIQVDGKDLSIEIVRAGLACHFVRYSSDPVLARAQESARTSRLGFWAEGASKPRCIAASAGKKKDD